MVTVGNMMAKVVRNKVKPSDPVSEIMYKQFKQVGILFIYFTPSKRKSKFYKKW